MTEWITRNLPTILAGVAIGVTVILWALDRFVLRRRRLSWRVHLNAPLTFNPNQAESIARVSVTRRDPVPDPADSAAGPAIDHTNTEAIMDPSIVLIRVKNVGRVSIPKKDIESLSFRFPGRTVKSVKTIDPLPDSGVQKVIDDRGGPTANGDTVEIPKFELNSGVGFKVFALLSGTGTEVANTSYLGENCKIIKDTASGRPRTSTLVFSAICLVLVGVFVTLWIVYPQHRAAKPTGAVACGSGALTIDGSTAFAPTLRQVRDAYHEVCGSTRVHVGASGSLVGLRELRGSSPAGRLAASDVPAPGEFGPLVAHPIAVGIFTMVVNKDTELPRTGLDQEQLRRIYEGRITNWRQLGGADLPISLVSRGSESGTRETFEQRVLGEAEPGISSNDCRTKDRNRRAPVIRCELPTTSALLDAVNRIPGAIGYAEMSATAPYRNIDTVQLDQALPDIESAKSGAYPFWAVEYLYSSGPVPGGSAAEAFLRYLMTDTAKNIMRRGDYVPCVDEHQNLSKTLCRG